MLLLPPLIFWSFYSVAVGGLEDLLQVACRYRTTTNCKEGGEVDFSAYVAAVGSGGRGSSDMFSVTFPCFIPGAKRRRITDGICFVD